MAVRPGPNQVGPKGWLQSLTDGLKLPFKEEIIPKTADKVVYFIAPVISATVAFTAFSVIPFGPVVSMFGHKTAAAAHRRAGVRAGAARLLVDGGLRRGAGRLGVRVDVPAARRPAVQRADDLVRGRDGPVHRGRLHDRRHDVDVADRRGAGRQLRVRASTSSAGTRPRRAGTRSCCCPASSSTASPRSARPTGPRSTCPRRSPSWSAASTPSTRRSSSRCSSWPSTST